MNVDLINIDRYLAEADSHLKAIRLGKKLLKSQGIFDGIPTEDWQDRGGQKYLYLVFRKNNNGTYQGPQGQRKIYIGNKPVAVKSAKDFIIRTQDYEVLSNHEERLQSWTINLHRQIDCIRLETSRYPVLKDWRLNMLMDTAASPLCNL